MNFHSLTSYWRCVREQHEEFFHHRGTLRWHRQTKQRLFQLSAIEPWRYFPKLLENHFIFRIDLRLHHPECHLECKNSGLLNVSFMFLFLRRVKPSFPLLPPSVSIFSAGFYRKSAGWCVFPSVLFLALQPNVGS